MRPGQNKRMRGRNNNNRKGPNPLTRTYESNGPDVKIRGTAHHIGEKYLQLARDAQSSGDPVMAESYLQHAEHYFRIIAAAQQAQQQAQAGYMRPAGETEAEEEDDDEGGIPDRFASPLERMPPNPPQQQPYGGQPQPFSGGSPQPFVQNNFGSERPQGQPQGERQERGPRPDRPYQDRNGQQSRHGNNPNRGPRPQRDFRNDQQPRFENRTGDEQPESGGLPAFITAPVRIPVNEAEPSQASDADVVHTEENESGGFHLRPRRRRRRPEGEGETPTRGENSSLD
jgi:hypothetical protein